MGFSLSKTFKGIGDVAKGVLTLGGSYMKDAAKAANKGSDAAIAEQRRQFDLTRGDLLPFLEGGKEGLNMLLPLLRGEINPENDPFLSSELNLANKAAGRAASASGRIGSGSYNKDLLRGTSGVLQNRIAQLMGLAGAGQSAGTSIGGFGANSSNAISGYLQDKGLNNAGVSLGRANTVQNILNQVFKAVGASG